MTEDRPEYPLTVESNENVLTVQKPTTWVQCRAALPLKCPICQKVMLHEAADQVDDPSHYHCYDPNCSDRRYQEPVFQLQVLPE